jgi:hypothetical protein
LRLVDQYLIKKGMKGEFDGQEEEIKEEGQKKGEEEGEKEVSTMVIDPLA